MRINKKTIISIVLCLAAVFMGVGYSILSTNLKITGGANITSTWDVRITGIVNNNASGSAYNLEEPSFTNDTARFRVALVDPGDSMTYTVTIENHGTITAILNSLNITTSGTDAIIYEVTGIKEGDTLAAGDTKNVTVVARYNSNVIADPDQRVKTLSVGLEWVQYTNQVITPGTYTINYNANGGSGSMSGTTCTVGRGCTLRSNSFTKSGYTFAGWAISTTGAVVYTNGQSVTNLTSNGKTVTLYAVWNNVNSLVNLILEHNSSQSDEGIIFTEVNEKGLFYTNESTEDINGVNGTTHYFRGAVDNNYVKFGKDSSGNDILWRIVRINEDGSIRIIMEDSIGENAFNVNSSDNAHIGYMYGLTGLTSELTSPICVMRDSTNNKAVDKTSTYSTKNACENANGIWAETAYTATHANIVDSNAKKILDNWYTNNTNLSNYRESHLADAGFCNDRSISSGDGSFPGLGYGDYLTNLTTYGPLIRWDSINEPQFLCPNESNDLFTTKDSTKGNKVLNNPIGLITADEMIYSGVLTHYGDGYSQTYLSSNLRSISPATSGHTFILDSSGQMYPNSVDAEYGIHPVINLNSTVKVSGELPSGCTEQKGTQACPYIIDTTS